MKNFILLISLLIFSSSVLAGGVGYINYDKVVANYQFARNTLRDIQMQEQAIQQYLINKEKEFEKIESAVQKKKFEENVRIEMQAKEKAFNEFRDKKEEEVFNRIHAVSEKIRLEKGLDAVLDARSVFSGGVDITDALIQKLNSVRN